jgi:hypothetical protein
VENPRVRDFDPFAKKEGVIHKDEISAFALKEIGYLDDILLEEQADVTKSSWRRDLRTKSLDEAHDLEVTSHFYPPDSFSDHLLKHVIEDCVVAFGADIADLIPADIDTVRYKHNSMAGWGLEGKKVDHFSESRVKALRTISYHRRAGFTANDPPPHIGLSRCQLGTLSLPKVRLVWAVTFHVFLIQMMVAQPIYRFLSEHPGPTVFGMTLEEQASRMSSFEREEQGYNLYRVDWPSFDTGGVKEIDGREIYCHGVQPWEHILVSVVFVRFFLRHLRASGDGGDIILFLIELYYCISKRLSAYPYMYSVTGLQASGDAATWLRDSILSFARARFLSYYLKMTIRTIMVGGDDGLLAISLSTVDWTRVIEACFTLFRTTYAPPPKSASEVNPSRVVFHGRTFTPHHWMRSAREMLSYALLRERSSLVLDESSDTFKYHAGISVWRLRMLFQDSGRIHDWLLRAADYIVERWKVCEIVDPDEQFFSTEQLLV